jgi:hypothetical protein
MSALEDDFHRAMIGVYETAQQHGYIATYFKRMLDEHGGLNAAKRLLAGNTIQSGLMKLWELRLLEHSMEALVVQERFRSLFTEAEIQEARRRLGELGFVRP